MATTQRPRTGTTPTSGSNKTIDDYKKDYASATTQAQKDAAHAGAEAIRNSQGYSGGTDGSQRIPTGNTGSNTGSSYTPSGSSRSSNGSSYTPLSDYNDQGIDANSQAEIDRYKAEYDAAYKAGDRTAMEQAHANAESVRARAGYSGGVDGSGYQITRQDVLPQEQEVERIKTLGDTVGSIDSLREEARKYGVEGQAMLASQLDQTLQMINQLETQITGQIQSQMNGEDPGLLSAIALVKDEVTRQRDDTLEELNARGLVQSGVYAEMLDRINKNELSQVQQLVGSRTADLQNQLNNAIMSVAQMRIGAVGANQTASMGLFQSTANNMSQLGIAGVNANLTARGQDLQNSQYYSGLNQNQSQFDKTFQQNEGQFAQNMKFNYANLNQDATLTREGFANSRATAGAGNALGWAQLGFQREQAATERTDALNAMNTQNRLNYQNSANQQIAQLQQSGGLDNIVKQIVSGQLSKADAIGLLGAQNLSTPAVTFAGNYIDTQLKAYGYDPNKQQTSYTGWTPNPYRNR